MKIACEACGAKYTIADDKVRGRRVKIRCKGCGTPIVVDGQNGRGTSISDAETDSALEAEGPLTWSVNLSETDSRTMTTEEIVAAYASGVVTADAFIWKDGMADWVPLLDSELAPLLAGAAAPNPAASLPGARGGMPLFSAPNQGTQSPRPAATTHSAQPNTQDLFGSLDSAGSEEEVALGAPSVPQAGSGAYDDGKLTGARNENSVLFSLDALKAGFSPSAPAAAKPAPKVPAKAGLGAARPQQPSNPDDPFGMNASAGQLGGGGALFGADNQALMTAPAPPPPPVAPAASYVAGATPAQHATKPNKIVYIVGGVGGVVIIGLLLALLLGKKSDSSATADSSAAPSASAAPANTAEKPAEEAKKEEPVKPSEAPSASVSAAPSASAAPSGKSAALPAGGIGATPKKPKEDAPPPADAQPFSKASAISALGAAAASAGSCKKPGGPTGPGKATVTFAPSGRVTTATVAGGSYAGTGVGGCVASVFRRAHVPPFSGSSVTVSKSFQIN